MTADHSRLARLRFVTILGLLSAFGPFSIDLYLPALPELTSELGASPSVGQLTLTASIAGLALGQLAWGPLSDRFGRRPPLLVGLAAYVLLSLACAAAPTIWALIGLRLLQGLAGAAGLVIARAIVRDEHEGVAAARLYSVLMIITGAAPIVAPVVGGQLLRVTDWRGLFVALAAVTSVVLVAATLGLRETLPRARRNTKGLRETGATFVLVSRDRRFVIYALTLGFAFAEMFSYIAGSPFVLEGIHGLSPQEFAFVFAMNAIGLMAVSQLNRALVGRVGLRRLLGLGVAAGTAAGLFTPCRRPPRRGALGRSPVPLRRCFEPRGRDPECHRARADAVSTHRGERLGAHRRDPVRLRRRGGAAGRRVRAGHCGSDGGRDGGLRNTRGDAVSLEPAAGVTL